MGEFVKYRRTQIAEMANWVPGFDMSGVSVSEADRKAGSPRVGDKIARNPANHEDRWLVAADYFAANFEAIAFAQAQEASLPSQGAASIRPANVPPPMVLDDHPALSSLDYRRGWNDCRDYVLRRIAASPLPAPQEPARPIAWMAMAFGVPAQATIDEPTAIRWRKAGGDVRPLYASPAPGELAQQAPSESSAQNTPSKPDKT